MRDVQDRLEGFGCKVEKIKCFAEELEPDPVREPVKDHENQEKRRRDTVMTDNTVRWEGPYA